MREILFRAKRVDNGEWVYSKGIATVKDILFLLSERKPILRVYEKTEDNKTDVVFDFNIADINTLCQFTGLTDKHGKKIFEGDIVEGVAFSNLRRGVIVFIDEISSFGVKYISRTTPTAWEKSSILTNLQKTTQNEFRAEVVGNIYDNPELLGD